MDNKFNAISEAAALIGAGEDSLTEEQAQKLLRSLVISNKNIRIRKARAGVERMREERNE
jgi:hypothetical protein